MILFLLQGVLNGMKEVTPLDDPRNPHRSGNGLHNSALSALVWMLLFFPGTFFFFFNRSAMKSKSSPSQISYMSCLWWEREDLYFWDFCHTNNLGCCLHLFNIFGLIYDTVFSHRSFPTWMKYYLEAVQNHISNKWQKLLHWYKN